MNCEKCKKNYKNYIVTEKDLMVPYMNDYGDLNKLLAFYQYCAPDINSVHSLKMPKEYHDEVIEKMFNKKKEYIFCANNANFDNVSKSIALNKNEICLRCKRLVCKRKSANYQRGLETESKLDSFLRHMRNAIAHGRVYIKNGGNYIGLLFEDCNNNGNISARIVCCKADLKKWKKIIETTMIEQLEM